MAAELH